MTEGVINTPKQLNNLFQDMPTPYSCFVLRYITILNSALPLIDSAVQGRGFLLVNTSLVMEHLRAGRLVKLLKYSNKSPYSLYLVAPEQQFSWNKSVQSQIMINSGNFVFRVMIDV